MKNISIKKNILATGYWHPFYGSVVPTHEITSQDVEVQVQLKNGYLAWVKEYHLKEIQNVLMYSAN